MPQFDVTDIFTLHSSIILDNEWRHITDKDDPNNPDCMYPCDMVLDSILWTEGPAEDNNPGFYFRVLEPKDRYGGPEFHLAEIKKFLKDGTLSIRKDEDQPLAY